MEIGVETVNFVHSLAPARQTLSKGTTSPQIFRPFTPGLEKATVISVVPTVWVTDPCGLGRGRSSFGGVWASAAPATVRVSRTRRVQRSTGTSRASRGAQHRPGAGPRGARTHWQMWLQLEGVTSFATSVHDSLP